MGAALSIFILLSLSVFVVRVASVALRLTGLEVSTARFQALSAFSGTGFTTREAETVVNYPVRRRIVSTMMVIGNVGLVSVFATLVASLVHTDGQPDAVLAQLAWLGGGLALLWFLILNGAADRAMCSIIGKVLESTTVLGKRRFHRLLQIGDGYSICEHPVTPQLLDGSGQLVMSSLTSLDLTILAARSEDGELTVGVPGRVTTGDALVLWGHDEAHETFAGAPPSPTANAQPS